MHISAVFTLSLIVTTGLLSAAAPPATTSAGPWKPLLDEKLSAWEIWIGAPHSTVTGLPEGTPLSPNGRDGQPLGLNNDPNHVFSTIIEDGEPVLHITGEIFGALSTRDSFSNYHLRVEFKWGQRLWEPRLKGPRDNGILYHCTGPHGVFWSAWKRCLEFQVQEKDMGDLFLLAGTQAEATATLDGKKWFYDPAGKLESFRDSKGQHPPAHLKGDFEKPNGEWNTLELYTVGRTAIHVVNGHIVMVVRNTALASGSDSSDTPLNSGQLQIQSEAAEAYYRRIEIRSIADFPADIKKAAGL